jgi:hypothetical protein
MTHAITAQSLQEKFNSITPDQFFNWLKEHGFSQFYRRSSVSCPFSKFLQQVLGIPNVGVGPLHCEIYFNPFVHIPYTSFQYGKERTWMTEFVTRVDSGARSEIEGWEAAAIMENIIQPTGRAPIPDALSLVRHQELKEKTYVPA